MNTALLKKIAERISNDTELRRFLEESRDLSEAQELLLSYYFDNKLSISDVRELMAMSYSFDKSTLDRIANLIRDGQRTREAEAIIWLEDNGFDKVVTTETLEELELDKANENADREIKFVYCRVKDRLAHLIKADKELDYEGSVIFEFLNITKNHRDFKLWRTYYGWCHDSNFRDESTRIISVGYILFRQYGAEYLKVIMDLPKFASDRGVWINFGSHLDYVVKMAEAKIAPQTIFDMFATIRTLSLPNKDSMSYTQIFGDRTDIIIQYWIKHPYKALNGMGHQRDMEISDFNNFIWCVSNSTRAASYALEAMDTSNEATWIGLMKVFNSICNHNANETLVKLLFEWLFTVKPKTQVKSVAGLTNKIVSKGYSFFEAFIMEAKLHPKKELLSILHRKGMRESLKFIYAEELGDDLFSAIYDIKKDNHLAGMCKYEMISIARNILDKSVNIDTMRKFLSKAIETLTYSQYRFINWLAKEDCPMNTELFGHIIKITATNNYAYEIERVSSGLSAISNRMYWPDLIRMEATACRVAGSIFTLQEAELLLDSKVSAEVFAAASNFLKEKRMRSEKAPFLWSEYSLNQYFAHLVKLGADHEGLFNLCVHGNYVNEELINFWIKHRNSKKPESELVRQTGWMYSYPFGSRSKLDYTEKNCETLIKIINEYSQRIPVALKAISLGIDFSQTMRLILDNELNDEKITEILLEKAGITNKS